MFIYLWRQLFTALLGLGSAVAPVFRQPIARFLPMQSVAPATTLDHAGDPLDRWTSRARPTFLYVMYAMMLWAFPLGLTAAFSPQTARAMTTAMTDYLEALPKRSTLSSAPAISAMRPCGSGARSKARTDEHAAPCAKPDARLGPAPPIG